MSFMTRPSSMLPLSDAQLAHLAPAAFATGAHESRSERYTFISTADVVAGMRKEGFVPMHAAERRTRDESKKGFTKHLIRFRHESQQGAIALNGTFPEVVLINGHDGSATYNLMGGLFRLVCLNGMVVSEGHCAAVKVQHSGNVMRRVIEGSYEVLDDSIRALEATRDWSGIILSRPEQMAYAEQAHALRFADASGLISTPIKPEALLEPRRQADVGDNLWLTYQRVQEAATKGGLSAWDQRTRRTTTSRAVTSIDGDVKLQRSLHALTVRMAELKA